MYPRIFAAMSWPAGRVAWRRSLNWEEATLGLVMVAAAYIAATILARSLVHPTSEPHFQVLAAAFLHGHLDVPPGTYDAAHYNGYVYLPFGPLPALILMPAVAIFGTAFPIGLLAIAATIASAPALLWLFRLLGVTELWTEPGFSSSALAAPATWRRWCRAAPTS